MGRQSFYDEIEIEDFTWDADAKIYHYPCPCGDRFEITKSQLRDGDEVAKCPSCSLLIRVIYEWDEYEDYDSSEEDEPIEVAKPTPLPAAKPVLSPLEALNTAAQQLTLNGKLDAESAEVKKGTKGETGATGTGTGIGKEEVKNEEGMHSVKKAASDTVEGDESAAKASIVGAKGTSRDVEGVTE